MKITSVPHGTLERARPDLQARLQERRGEIEEAIATRVYAVSNPAEVEDPIYAEGLRQAIAAAIDYGLAGIGASERNPPQLPLVLLAQARIAARHRIGLDTVLRRYFAGHAVLGDFLIEVAEGLVPNSTLKGMLQSQAAVFDRLLAAVSEEHTREAEERLDTAEERRAELVERLLAGERLDASELAYDLEGGHIGLLVQGPGAPEMITELARSLDRRLLSVSRGEQTLWAWLGGRRALDPKEIERLIPQIMPDGLTVTLGEPGEGISGWRLSHRQAKAALPIAFRDSKSLVRYADVALLASILQDDLLITSLREIYLAPLEAERDEGKVARETLRAYFQAGRNVSSAAALLGVSRNTIANRIGAIEVTLGRTLDSCVAECEAAMQLEDTPVRASSATFAL